VNERKIKWNNYEKKKKKSERESLRFDGENKSNVVNHTSLPYIVVPSSIANHA
jgi:hypothetical protein